MNGIFDDWNNFPHWVLTLDRYELIQLTKVFFWTRSCSSETEYDRVRFGFQPVGNADPRKAIKFIENIRLFLIRTATVSRFGATRSLL